MNTRSPVGTRLGRRLLGWFLALSLVPLIGSNMLGFIQSSRIIEELIGRQLDAIASVEAMHVRDQVDGALLGLEMVAAANPGYVAAVTGRGSPGDLEAELRHKLDELWQFDALYVTAAGRGVVATTFPFPDEPLPERDELHLGGGAVVDVLEGPSADGRPVFRMSVPLSAPGSAPEVRLGALMGPRGLGGLLDIPPHLAGSIESFVVDGRGRPLFISHPHGHVDYRLPLRASGDASEARSLSRYLDAQGQAVFGISVPIDELGWRYIAEFPVDAALGPLEDLRRVSLLFGSGFALLLVVAAWFVSGGIVAPVRSLASAARQVGAGDLSVRAAARGTDEIGDLGRAFNQMTEDLAAARSQLEELHRQEIRRAQQLATVGELASGVAHEIKNPVVGIAGGLDLVRRRIGEDEKLSPILDEMARQIERIGMAVRDLLAFARPSDPTFARVDPAEIANRAVLLVGPGAEASGVRLTFEAGEAEHPVQADPEQIRQALVNLLVNAVQATPSGGSVTVSVHQTGDTTEFRVRDTGAGIAPERLDEIFRPFFTTKHAGSGLGLSISRDIAERHGGGIRIRTSVGEGSEFTLWLPSGVTGTRGPGAPGPEGAETAGREAVR